MFGRIIKQKYFFYILLIGVILFSVSSALAQDSINFDVYKDICSDINSVKSITVNDDNILIEFDLNSGSFNMVYNRDKNNTVIPLERKSVYTLKIAENIGWGDGDHVSLSIVLDGIKDGTAYLTVGDEHRPPASHAHLAYNKSRQCKVDHKYTALK